MSALLRGHPSSVELLQAVLEFVRDRMSPTLTGDARRDARIACSLLEIVQREISLLPAAAEAEDAALRSLLNGGFETELQPSRLLCRMIAEGRIALDDQDLLAALWSASRASLAIDQPLYRKDLLEN